MLNFKKEGAGKNAIILLHGWGGSWQSWTPIISALKSKYTVYALDLPGFGLSKLTTAYNTKDYSEDLKEFLVREKITNPILVGHSFGGQIAVRYALENSESLKGLVLVDAAVVRNNTASTLFNITVARLGKQLIAKTPLKHYYKQLRNHYYKLRRIEASDYFAIEDNPPLAETLSNIMREDLLSLCYKINTPTLLFWGENDPTELTPLKQGKLIQSVIKNSKLVIIPKVGHFSYLEAPDEFVSELINFIKSL